MVARIARRRVGWRRVRWGRRLRKVASVVRGVMAVCAPMGLVVRVWVVAMVVDEADSVVAAAPVVAVVGSMAVVVATVVAAGITKRH